MECVLYFDNTQSMSGFVRAENSDFIRTTDSVYELMSTWTGGRSFWYIDRVGANLGWKQFSTGEAKFKEAYKHPNPGDKNCFYTYNKGSFVKGMGPLQLLFPEQDPANKSIVDFSKLNIFITDMAEQNKENMDLAKNLQEIVRGYKNHSVVLFAARSNFTGQASVADSGSVGEDSGSNMVSSSFRQARLPFYIIIIGPTEDTLKFSHDLRKYFLEPKNIEHHYAAFLSNGGLQEVKLEQIDVARTVGIAGLELEALLKGELTVTNSNETFQLAQKYKSDIYPPATVDSREQNALYFDLTQQKKDLTQALATLYISLPSLLDPEGNGQSTLPTVYKDLGAGGAGIACGVTDTQGKPQEQVFLLYSSAPRAAPTSATSPTSDTSAPPAQVQNQWAMSERDKQNQYISVNTEVLRHGVTVPRISGDSTAPLAKQAAYEVKSANGALQLQLRLRSIEALRQISNKGYISVRLPVTAVMDIPQNIPLWVKEWTYYANESTNPNDKFLKTEGLDSFFHVMHNSFGDAQSLPEHRKVILDLAIDIRLSVQ